MNRVKPPRRLVEGSSVRERAYRQVLQKIASAELEAGHPISELALAKELGMSRTPIREALGQLVAEGVLEQGPNGGASVVKLTRQDMIDLYELREALEVYAVGKAARQPLAPSELDTLQKLADATLELKQELDRSGNPALDAQQMRRFIAHDFGFHARLMHLSANNRIRKVVNETRVLTRIFAMGRQGHGTAQLERIHREHGEVVGALAQQDRERAMRVISDHIQNSLRERLEDFDRCELETSLRDTFPFVFDIQRLTEAGDERENSGPRSDSHQG